MTLDTLHREYGRYLLACLRHCGVPLGECEDVRQDLYLKLLESDYDLSTVREPKGFCAKMARNAAIDYARCDRGGLLDSLELLNEDGDPMDHPELAAQALSRCEEMEAFPIERVDKALLHAAEYEVSSGITALMLIECLLQDMTHRQIATHYGVRRETVSRWLNKWYSYSEELL